MAPDKTSCWNVRSSSVPVEQILGLRFIAGTAEEAAALACSTRGFVVVAALPALVKLQYDESFRHALQLAGLVLADSGLLALLWRALGGRHLPPTSSVDYLEALLHSDSFRGDGSVIWIVRSDDAAQSALHWLASAGYRFKREDFLVPRAAHATSDHELLLEIEERKPAHVIISTGWGTQEVLAAYLREYLLHRPAIHCVGAALAFLSGSERRVPRWAGRLHLGWLLRLSVQPQMTLPRVGLAFALAAMVLRYRSELPPLKQRWADL